MSRVPFNDLGRQDEEVRRDVADALARVHASGWFLQGPERAAFEAELAAYVGVPEAVGVANGTDAIALALLGVGCDEGDEVITAANAGMYTTTAALGAGLQPRYADVDPVTLCLSAETVEAALTERTRAVVVTHLYGRLADIEPILDLCARWSVHVVEDCAQAIGAQSAGRRAGAFGHAAAFSFYPTKNLGAMGDAGAVLTRSPAVAERVRMLSQYGWESKYRVRLPRGRNSRLDELQAAVLRALLPRLDGWNARRRVVALRYAASLPDPAAMVAIDGEQYVGHLAVVRVARRANVREALEAAGIATDVHYPIPDHRQPVWHSQLDDVHLPATEAASEEILTVPCFPSLTDGEVDRVCAALGAHAAPFVAR